MPSKAGLEAKDGAVYTTSSGSPFPEPYQAQRLSGNGPLVLQDFHHIDLLQHFDRERIPERVVHAKGAGAKGFFEVTDDITDLSCADLFKKVGTKVPAVARFSTVGGESGSADTARDPRGFSVKLKTGEGIWDWVFNNTPIFFLRDPAKFPHFIHTQKRDPQTHLKDNTWFWEYASDNPESIHQFMILFGDRGVPDGYRKMHGYSGHVFKFVDGNGKITYVQIHLRSEQGTAFLTQEKSVELAGSNPDYATQDLFEAIEKKDFPEWTAYVQTMTPEQAEKFRYNILDLTKIWPHKEFPLRKFGRLVLNENPENYFAEVEQVAFAPAHVVPGVEPSTDPVLQSRLFSYADTHKYRLGVNYNQLPINAPVNPVANFQRDGRGAINNQGKRPNFKSQISPLTYKAKPYKTDNHESFMGAAIYDLSEVTELDFEQPRALWQRVFDDAAKERFVNNVAGHLGGVQTERIKKTQVSIFAAVDQELGDRIAKAIGIPKQAPYKAAPASQGHVFRAQTALHAPRL